MADSHDPNAPRPARPFIPPARPSSGSNSTGRPSLRPQTPPGRGNVVQPFVPPRPFVSRNSGGTRAAVPEPEAPLPPAPASARGTAEEAREAVTTPPLVYGETSDADVEPPDAVEASVDLLAPDAEVSSTAAEDDRGSAPPAAFEASWAPAGTAPREIDPFTAGVDQAEDEAILAGEGTRGEESSVPAWLDATPAGANETIAAEAPVQTAASDIDMAEDAVRAARSAEAVAFALELLAQRIRSGQLPIPVVDGEVSEQGALVAALAALTGLRL